MIFTSWTKIIILGITGIFLVTSPAEGAGVPAPDDSESTVLPTSLVYNRPEIIEDGTRVGSGDEVVETHYSTCQITTEELVASAKGTVTRVLKGLCNAREMDDRFHNLESQFGDQMNVLKSMLLNIEERVSDLVETTNKINKANGIACNQAAISSHSVASSTQDADEYPSGDTSVREREIELYNSSIYYVSTPPDVKNASSSKQRIFTYYWRIRDMRNKMSLWEPRRSLRSPGFYVSPESYKMYIRLYPRQDGKNVYLHVGLTKGEYDAKLAWPFTLKHRVTVLDQRSENPQDISSRVWDPVVLCSGYNWRRPTSGDNYECVGLGFPQDVLRSRDYVTNNTLVVKLTVYLDL